jgi:hypothetical protein
LKELQDLIADTKLDLLVKIPHGTGQTLLREALLVADHNSYHLGQIMLLRRTLEARAGGTQRADRSRMAAWTFRRGVWGQGAILETAAAAGLTVTSVVEERCPVLKLPDTWETYLASLSSKHRHEMSRKIRRFEREEPSGRVTIESTAAGVAARLDDFLDLHRQSRVGKARFMDERMEGFFRSVIVALAAQGVARLNFLDTPTGPIASFVTLEWDDTVGLYNSGFRPDCAPLSPGLVLLAGLAIFLVSSLAAAVLTL